MHTHFKCAADLSAIQPQYHPTTSDTCVAPLANLVSYPAPQNMAMIGKPRDKHWLSLNILFQ